MAVKNDRVLTIGTILLSIGILLLSGLTSSIIWGLLMVCIIAGVYFFVLYR
ncbi:MAG: hypothetical protein WCH85_09240 [Methanomicrobiales archaeon]